MVDVIETGFLADWMPARKMEGREARCLATAKKFMFPVWISLKREILWYILSRQSPEAAYPQYSCFRGFVFFEGENRAVKCGAAAYIVSM